MGEKEPGSWVAWLRPSPPLRLGICVVGINVFYLYYGVLQEQLYRRDDQDGSRFEATFFLMFLQCFVNFLVAFIMSRLTGVSPSTKALTEKPGTAPIIGFPSGHAWVAGISLSYLLAMSASNQALMYVSYAFQALAKSCKMIPVMLGNVLLGSKRYSLKEYLVVLSITAGIILFNLSAERNEAGNDATSSSSYSGVIMLLIALVLDGVTASNQRLFTNEFQPSTHGLMMQMNAWSLVFLAPILVYTEHGYHGLRYLLLHPSWHCKAWLFSLCRLYATSALLSIIPYSAMGQNFIFYTITGPGVLACATITTTRKFFTILISVFLYPENSLNAPQWTAVLIVFCALFVELQDKYKRGHGQGHSQGGS